MLLVSLTLRSPTAPELRPPIILQLPPHVHEPYTRAEDRYLWDNQNGDMEAVATELGRGPLRLGRIFRNYSDVDDSVVHALLETNIPFTDMKRHETICLREFTDSRSA